MADPVLTASLWVTAATTALLTLWKAIKTIWKMAQRVQSMWELVERELKPNGGMSIKDKVQTISLRLDEIERLRLDELEATAVWRSQVLRRLHVIDGGPGHQEIEGVPV